MKLLSAKDPIFADPEGKSIELQATFEELKDEHGAVPFVAHSNDGHGHGREIFKRAKKGEFGKVKAYAPKPGPERKLTFLPGPPQK